MANKADLDKGLKIRKKLAENDLASKQRRWRNLLLTKHAQRVVLVASGRPGLELRMRSAITIAY
jgi:translation initiation factor IF-3